MVRHLTAKQNVDIRPIPGPGISGRVAAPAAAAPPPAAHAEASRLSSERVDDVIPMSPFRRTAEHAVMSKRTSATTVFEVDMTRVDQIRSRQKKAFAERSGIRLTFLPFIVKATVDALKQWPILNASVEGDSIVYKKTSTSAWRWRSTGASSCPSSATWTRRTFSASRAR